MLVTRDGYEIDDNPARLDLGVVHGFTRAVTDRATFAWVCDVFVLPGHQGRGRHSARELYGNSR
jgi:hypothetical protein